MSTTETPRFVIDGTEYEVPQNLTLGELRLLKREFDVTDVSEVNQNDPDHIAGMLFVAMRRKNPGMTIEQLDAIDAGAIDFKGEVPEGDEDARPTEDGAAA